MNPTADIIGAMFELHRIIRHRMVKAENAGDLNMHQMHTLVFIHEQPRITMSELAAMLHISQASATPLVARLIKMGLVKRQIDAKNRKLVRLSLTPRGKEILKTSLDSCHIQLQSIFSLIPKEDQAQFAAILKNLVSANHAPSSSSIL